MALRRIYDCDDLWLLNFIWHSPDLKTIAQRKFQPIVSVNVLSVSNKRSIQHTHTHTLTRWVDLSFCLKCLKASQLMLLCLEYALWCQSCALLIYYLSLKPLYFAVEHMSGSFNRFGCRLFDLALVFQVVLL